MAEVVIEKIARLKWIWAIRVARQDTSKLTVLQWQSTLHRRSVESPQRRCPGDISAMVKKLQKLGKIRDNGKMMTSNRLFSTEMY